MPDLYCGNLKVKEGKVKKGKKGKKGEARYDPEVDPWLGFECPIRMLEQLQFFFKVMAGHLEAKGENVVESQINSLKRSQLNLGEFLKRYKEKAIEEGRSK